VASAHSDVGASGQRVGCIHLARIVSLGTKESKAYTFALRLARLTSRAILCIGRGFASSSQLVFNTRNARKVAESSLCGPDPSAASDCVGAVVACDVAVACDAAAEPELPEATRTPILTAEPSLTAPAIAPLLWPAK
jgi:hypothetical protein